MNSQLVNDTLMPDHSKQPTGNSRGGDDSEDGELQECRGVGHCLFRYVRYRIGDGHGGEGTAGGAGWVLPCSLDLT